MTLGMQDTLHALADPTRRNEREGKFIYYELNATVLEEILLWISELKGGNDYDYDQTK